MMEKTLTGPKGFVMHPHIQVKMHPSFGDDAYCVDLNADYLFNLMESLSGKEALQRLRNEQEPLLRQFFNDTRALESENEVLFELQFSSILGKQFDSICRLVVKKEWRSYTRQILRAYARLFKAEDASKPIYWTGEDEEPTPDVVVEQK